MAPIPIYVWIIIVSMIYCSNHTVYIARLIGSNSISVLATLLLLSFAKLLRTVIAAFSPIYITVVDK